MKMQDAATRYGHEMQLLNAVKYYVMKREQYDAGLFAISGG